MGQKPQRNKESILIERHLFESFKDTDLEFPIKDVIKMKLRLKDAQSYFNNEFDYFVYFNNYIFNKGLSTIYDNYISKIENFIKNNKNNNIFYLYVDFDDEEELLKNG